MSWMVIFGAGASYDSVPEQRWRGKVDEKWRPPLTTQLFEHRPAHVDSWTEFAPVAGLINELWPVAMASEKDESAPGVEEYLQDLVERFGDREQLERQLMAFRFYLSDIIQDGVGEWKLETGPANNYATLLGWLERIRESTERLLLVTFNYDAMLEDARRTELRGEHAELEDWIAGTSLLFRPHGYVGWSRLTTAPSAWSQSRLIDEVGSYGLTEVIPAGTQQDAAEIPAIAVPTRAKAEFECPDEHIRAFITELPNITKVVTIGWRAQEETFLAMCREGLPPDTHILVVSGSGDSAKSIAGHLSKELPGAVVVPSDVDGFSALIERGFDHFIGAAAAAPAKDS